MNTGRANNSAGATVIHVQDAPTPHIQDAPIIHIQADAQTALVLDEEMPLPPAPIHERMRETEGKLDDDLSMVKARIHRFPESLRGIGGQDARYIEPSVVAIGPYHRRLPRVQKMQEIKHAVARYFCRRLGYSTEEVYDSVRPVAGSVRRYYDAADEAVKDLSDADLADMMFLDGCFLLQFMTDAKVQPFLCCDLVSRHSILRDMMLLENQIPWLVLEALMTFTMALGPDVRKYVADKGDLLLPEKEEKAGPFEFWFIGSRNRTDETERSSCGSYQAYRPAHLLDLLLFSQTSRMRPLRNEASYQFKWRPRARSAAELARMGVWLTASKATWLGSMSFRGGAFFGKFSLSPLFLNDFTACWLVNLAALEAIVDAPDWPFQGFVVSSYLSVMSMLVDREDDVHRLRVKSLLRSTMSDTQARTFFDSLGQHLSFGGGYFVILEKIDSYMQNRPMRALVYGIIYNRYRAFHIASLGSIVGVLIGIFKTLLSKKLE